MSNPSETTYTLAEAQRELQRRECAASGHSWDIVSTFDGTPVSLHCACGLSFRVEQP